MNIRHPNFLKKLLNGQLKVRPVARYCIDCNRELEKIQRQTGSPAA